MKGLFLAILILFAFTPGFAQKLYFFYVQSENDQPFFVKLSDRVYSSTASGYVIVPRLRDTVYQVTIGFPQNRFPEQEFSVALNTKDHGYVLKNFAERGWGLFDLQSLSVIMGVSKQATGRVEETIEQGPVTAFTEMLALAANDPMLRRDLPPSSPEEKPQALKQAVLVETVSPVAVSAPNNDPVVDTAAGSSSVQQTGGGEQKLEIEIIEPSITRNEVARKEPADEEKAELPKPTPSQNAETGAASNGVPATGYKRSTVTKKAESSFTSGFGLIFIDEYADGARDTIRIIIPNQKTLPSEAAGTAKPDRKFLDISMEDPVKPDSNVSGDKGESLAGSLKNPACKAMISAEDFTILQKKMLAEKSIDDMVDEAKKTFRTKCISSGQLRDLGMVMQNDEGRYRLFDAAYPFVSDPENFAALSSEIKNEYYFNRFRAMLRY